MKKLIFVFLIMFISINYSSLVSGEKIDHRIIPVATQQPENEKVYPIAIIGLGAAGSMAAKRAVLNNDAVLLFAGAKQERRRSRGSWVKKVHNIPGFEKYERTILQLRNEVLEDLVNSPFKQNLFIIENSITAIDKQNDIFRLVDNKGNIYFVKYVILATGMMDEQPHIEGSIRPILPFANRQSIAYCLLCDGQRSFQKKTVVIGYTDSAANGAILLSERYSPLDIAILTNGMGPQFNKEIETKLQERKISVITDPVKEILGNGGELAGFKLSSGETIPAEIGFVLLGIRPNNSLALQLGAEIDERGLVVTDSTGESSVANLFIAGDLRANSMKQIYTAWQHGVDCAQAINRRIRAGKN